MKDISQAELSLPSKGVMPQQFVTSYGAYLSYSAAYRGLVASLEAKFEEEIHLKPSGSAPEIQGVTDKFKVYAKADVHRKVLLGEEIIEIVFPKE